MRNVMLLVFLAVLGLSGCAEHKAPKWYERETPIKLEYAVDWGDARTMFCQIKKTGEYYLQYSTSNDASISMRPELSNISLVRNVSQFSQDNILFDVSRILMNNGETKTMLMFYDTVSKDIGFHYIDKDKYSEGYKAVKSEGIVYIVSDHDKYTGLALGPKGWEKACFPSERQLVPSPSPKNAKNKGRSNSLVTIPEKQQVSKQQITERTKSKSKKKTGKTNARVPAPCPVLKFDRRKPDVTSTKPIVVDF